MIPSKYNQITRLEDGRIVFFNLLSGAVDVGDHDDRLAFESGVPRTDTERVEWIERGYFFDSALEEQIYIAERYESFAQDMSTQDVQFMLVPTYACHFNCEYCYQKGIDSAHSLLDEAHLQAFISYIRQYRSLTGRHVTVTIFGGEPLWPGDKHRRLFERIIEELNNENIPMAIVTNGYYLKEYVPLLATADLREVHVSIDGDKDEHDVRRRTKEGKPTFDKIVDGLVAAKEADLPIQVRLIIDRKTLRTLPDLARRFEKLGFLDLPKDRFKTSLGRNYELINDYSLPSDLFELDEMYREYVKLMKIEPILARLHMPSFFGISQLVSNGEMYQPSFDTCPAAKSEWVFDAAGNIHGCTASCGRDDYRLGLYFPAVVMNEVAIKEWTDRNIFTIPKCRSCDVAVVCGGGCGVIAKDREGKVQAPNCKPIKAVMDEGIRYYEEYFK
jgi:uncharacterized protein